MPMRVRGSRIHVPAALIRHQAAFSRGWGPLVLRAICPGREPAACVFSGSFGAAQSTRLFQHDCVPGHRRIRRFSHAVRDIR